MGFRKEFKNKLMNSGRNFCAKMSLFKNMPPLHFQAWACSAATWAAF